MDAARARDAMRAGAWAVAVVGAITRSDDPHAAMAALRDATRPASQAPLPAVPAFARTTLHDAA